MVTVRSGSWNFFDILTDSECGGCMNRNICISAEYYCIKRNGMYEEEKRRQSNQAELD